MKARYDWLMMKPCQYPWGNNKEACQTKLRNGNSDGNWFSYATAWALQTDSKSVNPISTRFKLNNSHTKKLINYSHRDSFQ